MKRMLVAASLLAFLLAMPPVASGQGAAGAGTAGLKQYQSPYYVIHTDLPDDEAKEAVIRMTKMAEEYRDRTRDFSGVIRSRLPF